MTTLQQIDEFLGLKRLAVVGVSRRPKDFTRSLFRELQQRGYDLVPVHPDAAEIEGRRCFGRVAEIHPKVDGALLLTKPAVTDKVVRECRSAGIRHVWMYQAAGAGAVSPTAVKYCADEGISLVAGECPFMFLPETQWIHRAHRFCRKLVGRYPK